MRVLVTTTDYPSFLAQFYARNPDLMSASFAEQSRASEETLFKAASFYVKNFTALGHVSAPLYANNFYLQAAWARERGMKVPAMDRQWVEESHAIAWLKRRLRPYKSLFGKLALRMSPVSPLGRFERDVLLAQIEEFSPDVILNQDIQAIDSALIGSVRKPGRLIAAQLGVDPPPGLDASVYDLGISHIPWVVEFFRQRGLRALRQELAFEPSVLKRLGPPPEKDIDVSFVGALSSAHGTRVALLEAVARRFNLSLFTPSLKGLPASSPLYACKRGETYGRDMYNALRRSRLTLNTHINVARGSAGNMRLFEATGVGTFLMTDGLEDLSRLFEPDVEVGIYRSVGHCLDRIAYFLDNPVEREAIARRGQARTLANYSYASRVRELVDLFEKWTI